MKNKISIILLSLLTVFAFTACEEDQEIFDGPYRLTLGGPRSGLAGGTATYTLGDIQNPDSYTWTISDPSVAQFVGAGSGATVVVEFLSVGDFELSVTNGTDFRDISVEVEPIEPTPTVALDTATSGIALSGGESGMVFLHFAGPVESIGSIEVTEDPTQFNEGEPFVSGSISDLQRIDENTFSAVYTAGEGNGTPEAAIYGITGTDASGGVTIDTAYVQLYRVDNEAPTADLTYSQNRARAGSDVTVTATFSEEVMGERMISLTQNGVTETAALEATDDPLVYTYTYTAREGEGTVNVELTETTDFAGNEVAAVTNANRLVIDNTAPVVEGVATDNGNVATIGVFSTEAGTARYLVLEEGDAAPASVEEFMANEGGVAGALSVVGNRFEYTDVILSSGLYDVYFLAEDEAGNFSDIASTVLVMD